MKVNEIITYLQGNDIAFIAMGDSEQTVNYFSSIYNYKPETVSWLRKPETLDEIEKPAAINCLITGMDAPEISLAQCQIKVEDPRAVFFRIVDVFWGEQTTGGISPQACVEQGAVIGENTQIGAFTMISAQTEIGRDCRIGNNVTIRGKVRIGDRCVIQSGAVIGEDGFAHTKDGNGDLVFVKHYGGVWMGNDVSVGANACICRGTIDDTILHDMVKVDNLCHIAHNVVLEKRVQVIAGAVVMGSVHVGQDSWVATSMIRDQRKVGAGSVIGMGAVVVKDVADGTTVAGNPAKPFERKEKI